MKFNRQLPANQYLNELFRYHFNGLFKLLISSVIELFIKLIILFLLGKAKCFFSVILLSKLQCTMCT